MSSPLSSSSSFRTLLPVRVPSRKAFSSWTSARAAAWISAVATTVAVFAAAVSPASATPVDVFFDGPRPVSDPNTAFGISLASATTANTTYGVPIISQLDLLTSITNRLSILQPPSSELIVTPNPPTSTLNRVTSNWQVENVSGSPMTGASYLLFTHTSPYSVGSKTIDYPDDKVGLKIDKDLGWVIIKARAQGVDYYYPALLLDRSAANALAGNIAAGQRVSASINYVVTQALTLTAGNYQLPKLQLGFAQVVVPEPGAALLLGLGLAVLSGRRRNA